MFIPPFAAFKGILDHQKHALQSHLRIYTCRDPKDTDLWKMAESQEDVAKVLAENLISPLCARGCSQSLTLIHMGTQERYQDGNLTFYSPMGGKYSISLEAEDIYPPAFSTSPRGGCFLIESMCPFTLGHVKAGTDVALPRIPADVYMYDTDVFIPGVFIRTPSKEAKNSQPLVWWVECDDEGNSRAYARSETDGFLGFRPIFTALLMKFSVTSWEWGPRIRWKAEFEEC